MSGLKMADVSDKKMTRRKAVAKAVISAPAVIIRRIRHGELAKGDCLAAAQAAGILAAKNTASLIPLCHPLPLTHVDISFSFARTGLEIVSTVKASYATGVEMEALCACAAAALTIYDMAKGYDKGIVVRELRLLEKSGGKSGNWKSRVLERH
ncbi:MAG: cyclic pyranopterin monophosphate synthase MoaC [Candidatus Omnitrophota bacterium]